LRDSTPTPQATLHADHGPQTTRRPSDDTHTNSGVAVRCDSWAARRQTVAVRSGRQIQISNGRHCGCLKFQLCPQIEGFSASPKFCIFSDEKTIFENRTWWSVALWQGGGWGQLPPQILGCRKIMENFSSCQEIFVQICKI